MGNRRWNWLILGLILVVGAWLRLKGIGVRGMYFDEGNTILPSLSWHQIFFRVIHPPLHYLVTVGWITLFGDTLSTVRVLYALIDIANVFMVYRLAMVVTDRRSVAELTSAIYALLPAALLLGRMARHYSLWTLAILVLLQGFCLLLKSEFREGRRTYQAGLVLSLLVHHYSCFWIFGTAAVFFWTCRKRMAWCIRLHVPVLITVGFLAALMATSWSATMMHWGERTTRGETFRPLWWGGYVIHALVNGSWAIVPVDFMTFIPWFLAVSVGFYFLSRANRVAAMITFAGAMALVLEIFAPVPGSDMRYFAPFGAMLSLGGAGLVGAILSPLQKRLDASEVWMVPVLFLVAAFFFRPEINRARYWENGNPQLACASIPIGLPVVVEPDYAMPIVRYACPGIRFITTSQTIGAEFPELYQLEYGGLRATATPTPLVLKTNRYKPMGPIRTIAGLRLSGWKKEKDE